MTKEQMLKDYLVTRCMSQGKTVKGYREIYYRTNEDLIDAYLDVDFYGKDVLSVLAASDHVFTANYLDAKKTDSFDSNRLTIYYYYLRIWSIEYMNELFPKVLEEDCDWLKLLLSKVTPRNEQEQIAFNFFKQHALLETNFIPLFNDLDKQCDGKTLYTKAEELKDTIDPELKFYNTNIFDRVDIDNTYDIVLISNILDLAYNDKDKLIQARDNLKRLVRKDGHVICSGLLSKTKSEIESEKEIFSDYFDYEPKEKGYVYIKKNN